MNEKKLTTILVITVMVLSSVVCYHRGYETRKEEVSNAMGIVDKGQWGKDFMIYSTTDHRSFGFQVHNKQYDVMSFKTLKFLIDSQVFFDRPISSLKDICKNCGGTGIVREDREATCR